ncbi:MAG: hypothetical protein ACMZI0_07975 [Symbiopectobacterium sp.]|uniref:hypothetical protein n=1 Tax=Symbiopectobacterium sp. TaxID=2952789 RepID=UPI0039EC7C10
MEQEMGFVFMPSLISILINAQEKKGALLTQEEVEGIRDRSVVMSMPKSVCEKMDKDRGYKDIDPEFAWLEYLHHNGVLDEIIKEIKSED